MIKLEEVPGLMDSSEALSLASLERHLNTGSETAEMYNTKEDSM